MTGQWPKIIAHIDMDAYFAQIEQRDDATLQGRAIAITNGELGSCIITCSYEARAYGIKTGMRIKEAHKLCPNLIHVASRPKVYAETSVNIMTALSSITPDIEIFSVDEAFLDLSHCRGLYTSAKQVALLIQEVVMDASGLTCSVGISGDKTTAKIASKQKKPNGITLVAPWHSQQVLSQLLVTDLCGINKGIAQFLSQYDVYRCADIKKIPINVLSQRFGNYGKRLWHMCLGQDPEPVRTTVSLPQSIGHGKVLPPNTQDKATVLYFLSHMSEKVGQRLRRYHMRSKRFYIGIKIKDQWLADRYEVVQPTDDGQLIYQLAKGHIQHVWRLQGVFQCQVTAINPMPGEGQLDLFEAKDARVEQLNNVIDHINNKFGHQGITRAHRLQPLAMPDVISPAWNHTSAVKLYDF